MPRGRRRTRRIPRCSILGCSLPGIVQIMIHGDRRAWYACESEHAQAIIWDIKYLWPGARGITTKGVGEWRKG